MKMMSLDKRFGLSLVPHSLLTKKGKGYAVSHHFLFDQKKGSSRAAPKAGQCKVVENELLQLILLLILVMQK